MVERHKGTNPTTRRTEMLGRNQGEDKNPLLVRKEFSLISVLCENHNTCLKKEKGARMTTGSPSKEELKGNVKNLFNRTIRS